MALEVDRYLTKAFFLRLRDVRNVEASACLGGEAYSDEQIDQLLLPLIAGTQNLWAVSRGGEPHAANGQHEPSGARRLVGGHGRLILLFTSRWTPATSGATRRASARALPSGSTAGPRPSR